MVVFYADVEPGLQEGVFDVGWIWAESDLYVKDAG
jgi:hypothetical protein